MIDRLSVLIEERKFTKETYYAKDRELEDAIGEAKRLNKQ